MISIGEKIKRRRKELGLTQAEIAEPHFTRGFISQIENGIIKNPPYKTVEIIANKLAVSTNFLLGKEEEETNDATKRKEMIEKAGICSSLIRLKRFDEAQQVLKELKAFKRTEYLGYINELQGSLLYAQKEYGMAIPFFEEAMIYLGTENLKSICEIYQKLAECCMHVNDYDKAIDAGISGLMIYNKSRMSDHLLQLKLFYILAYCHCRRKEYKQGLKYIEEAVSVSKSENIYYRYGSFKMLQGHCYNFFKNDRKAISYTKEALNYLEDPKDVIGCLTNLGIFHRHLDDYDQSSQYLMDSLSMAKKEQLTWYIKNNLYELSFTNIMNKKNEKALALVEEGIEIKGYQDLQAKLYYNLGLCNLHFKNFSKARMLIDDALNLFRELNMSRWVAKALSLLSEVMYEEGDTSSAFKYMKTSISIYDKLLDHDQ
ncbi:helix-turn-helix domain-containing protein [Heyndrickxia acidiproducens]|uniref:helix-turn-helix domain-containing protein n=1 Tax=Heyndrickxia acidiproducens TaxID=1121084 RepID=UPI00037FAE46|nr:tetratricopeptide repeat protein [Heyndrickxia acidiproducens]